MPGVKTKYAVSEILDGVKLIRKVSFGGPYAIFNIYDVLAGKAPRSLFLLKKDLVLKHLCPNSPADGQEILQRITNSIRALSCIQHPGFLELEGGIVEGPDHIAFITEQVVSSCAEPLKADASFILSELLVLADGIAHIQDQGRAYLDIAPSGVVLTASGHLKLCTCSGLLPTPHQPPSDPSRSNQSNVCLVPKETTGSFPLWGAPEQRFQSCYSSLSDSFSFSALALRLLGLKGPWSAEPLTSTPPHTEAASVANVWRSYIVNPDRPEDNAVEIYSNLLGSYSSLAQMKTAEMVEANEIIPTSLVPANIALCLARALSPVVDQRPSIKSIKSALSTPQAKLALILSSGNYVGDVEREMFLVDPGTRVVAKAIKDTYIKDVILPRLAECGLMVSGGCGSGNAASLYVYSLLTLLHKVDKPMVEIVFEEWTTEELCDAAEILGRLRGNIACIISASSSAELSEACSPFCMKLIEIIPLLYKTAYEECGKPLLFWAMTNSTPKITAVASRVLLHFSSWCEQKKEIIEQLQIGERKPINKKNEEQTHSLGVVRVQNACAYSFISNLISDILLIILNEKFIPETLNPTTQLGAYNKYVRNRILLVGTYAKYALKEDITLFLQNLISNSVNYDVDTLQAMLWLLHKIKTIIDINVILLSVIPFVTQLVKRFSDAERHNALQRSFSLLCAISNEVTKKISEEDQRHKDQNGQSVDDPAPTLQIETPCQSIIPKSNNPDLEVFVKATKPSALPSKTSSMSKIKPAATAAVAKMTDMLGITNTEKEIDPEIQSINNLLSF